MNGPERTQDIPWNGRLEAMEALLTVARSHTLTSFLTGQYEATLKRDGTLVTKIDQEAESAMRDWLNLHFPDDGVVGEEAAPQKGCSKWTWVIDPIDGTASFCHQVPMWGTLVALRYDGWPVAGACDLPVLEVGAKGTCQEVVLLAEGRPQRITASPSPNTLQDATLVTTGWDYFRMADAEEAYPKLAHRAARTKGWSDCYGLWLLLAGRVDVVVEPLLHPWDIEWLAPLAQAAGLKLTNWRGEDCVSPQQCVASRGGPLHDEVTGILQQHARS